MLKFGLGVFEVDLFVLVFGLGVGIKVVWEWC